MRTGSRMPDSIVGIVVMILLMASIAIAVPTTVNYQGYLTDDSGVPVSGTVSITFRIYDALTGGTLKWNETHDVDVNNGVYSVQLGSGGSPLDEGVFTGEARYLEVEIDGTPLSPRLAFTSNAYAFRAGIADSVADGAVGSAQIADNAVNTSEIASGAITDAKISTPLTLYGSSSLAMVAGTGFGVWGKHTTTGSEGYLGYSGYGVWGSGPSGYGVYGQGATGVAGINSGNGTGVLGFSSGSAGKAVYGQNTGGGHAGYFDGKVEVAGDLTVSGATITNSVSYASPQTHYENISAAEFVQSRSASNDDFWRVEAARGYITSGTSSYSITAYAPVNLPEGATITELRCYYFDNDATYDLTMNARLLRALPSSGSGYMMAQAYELSSGSGTSVVEVFDDSVVVPTVDNSSASYSVELYWTQGAISGSLQFRGCRITYTVDTVAP